MTEFHKDILDLDVPAEIERITSAISEQTRVILNKRGLVIAASGGVDSSTTLALAARALGPENVLALSMPEQDSKGDSVRLAELMTNQLGIELIVEDISDVLRALKCYQRRDEAVKRVFPEYNSDYKFKIVLPKDLAKTGRFNVYHLVIEDPAGEQYSKRLPARELLEIIAATNFKQRTRKQLEYYHADRLNYAVAGTPNRLEYDQGFFVKGGDGLADLKPIAHLYKTQVYKIARYLGIPDTILEQPPTTDTYSLSQSQEEFFFNLPYHELDLMIWALNHEIPSEKVGEVMEYTADQVERVFKDIRQKRKTTEYLHQQPLLVEPLPQINTGVI